MRSALNLNIRAHRQLLNRHTRSCWQRAREELQVSRIHSIKVLHGRDEDVDFDHVVQGGTAGFENVFEVGEGLDLVIGLGLGWVWQ